MNQKLFLFFLFIVISFSPIAAQVSFSDISDEIKAALIPEDQPAKLTLDILFQNVSELNESAGFYQMNQSGIIHGGSILVFGHKELSGYLVKSYPLIAQDKDLYSKKKNYLERIRSAKLLQSYIQANDYQYLTVPQKWLYQLPQSFSEKYSSLGIFVMVVEDMNILPGSHAGGPTRDAYYNLTKEQIKELCYILADFRGCDAKLQNIPFTDSGKLAFVDTQILGQPLGDFIAHIVPYLNPELQNWAATLYYHRLSKNKQPKR